jgi:hypothetical protein
MRSPILALLFELAEYVGESIVKLVHVDQHDDLYDMMLETSPLA